MAKADQSICRDRSGVKAPLAGDLLRGAAAIADYTGLSRRAIYHAAQCGSLPIRNVTGLGLVARKSDLDDFFTTSSRLARPYHAYR